jgi:hypothetical protein
MRIFAHNPDLLDIEKTFLSDSTLKAATVFPVKNTDNFTTGRRLLVGEMSRERSELLTLGSKTIDQLTLGAANFPHDTDDPIYAIKYDKVRVYRATSETGTRSLLATIDVDVDNTDGKTWYEDLNSLDTFWYEVSYYDSVADEESDRSPAIQATGYARDQLGSIIMEVVRKVNDLDFIDMDAETYIDNANDVSVDLQTQAKRPYRFLKRSQLLDLALGASTINFPADLWSINYLEANDTSATVVRTFRPKTVSATEARAHLALYTLGGQYTQEVAYDDEANQLIVVPKALALRTGAFTLHYYKKFDDFTSFSSRIEGPTRLAYKLAMFREYYLAKADSNNKYLTKAQKYDNMYKVEVAKLQRTKNIDAGGPSGLGPDRKRYIQWGGPRYRQ